LASPQFGNTIAPSPEVGRRVWLLVIAMTAHNLPEGAAVGVGFGAGDLKIGISTAVGIGVQNLPEGLAVAAALVSIGTRRSTAVLIGGATGLVEPVGAFLGAAVVSLVRELLPFGMGWAAGAMIYIVAAELIPAIHGDTSDGSRGSGSAIWAFLIGLAAMLFLDVALS
jgi:ZIP family zinc transporter